MLSDTGIEVNVLRQGRQQPIDQHDTNCRPYEHGNAYRMLLTEERAAEPVDAIRAIAQKE
jgi:hypothetical protein